MLLIIKYILSCKKNNLHIFMETIFSDAGGRAHGLEDTVSILTHVHGIFQVVVSNPSRVEK